jgi:agmatinase
MNSLRERFRPPLDTFSGYPSKPLEESEFVIFGVPLDVTHTWMGGTKHGPEVIRYTSKNIESYSLAAGADIEEAKIHDLGDLRLPRALQKTLQSIRAATSEIRSMKKIPLILGGEHTIALGAAPLQIDRLAILQFDAHMDLRDHYEGRKVSHTTFMRRIAEKIDPQNIVQIGVRAISREERQFAEKAGILCVKASELSCSSTESIAERLNERLDSCEAVYLSIDIDVLDPAFAPAVGNPEAAGITPQHAIQLIRSLIDRRLVGVDLVEVSARRRLRGEPYFDADAIRTGVVASRILFETILALDQRAKPTARKIRRASE